MEGQSGVVDRLRHWRLCSFEVRALLHKATMEPEMSAPLICCFWSPRVGGAPHRPVQAPACRVNGFSAHEEQQSHLQTKGMWADP
ncbi:hypothetical protein NDU88_006410 [Pleurodeles waltl]|uniref:Uncharacterized protein n=1 Tax=Pleurodeles waltl TaxID=8319 RepID=A0AAV7QJZ1_PLEWA|nr:hypothetical protein NDU88_006410 [Pleurodeles waltl]